MDGGIETVSRFRHLRATTVSRNSTWIKDMLEFANFFFFEMFGCIIGPAALIDLQVTPCYFQE